MAPVSIHTAPPAKTILAKPPDKTTYVRIVRSENMRVSAERFVGKVGIISSVARNEETVGNLYFVDIPGAIMLNMFNEINVEEISKKEYFKGCLGGK